MITILEILDFNCLKGTGNSLASHLQNIYDELLPWDMVSKVSIHPRFNSTVSLLDCIHVPANKKLNLTLTL